MTELLTMYSNIESKKFLILTPYVLIGDNLLYPMQKLWYWLTGFQRKIQLPIQIIINLNVLYLYSVTNFIDIQNNDKMQM